MGKIKAKKINSNELNGKKPKKIRNKKYLTDSQLEIRRAIRIILITLVIIVAIYFLSVNVVNKRNDTSTSNTSAEIQYQNITVGMIFNRPYDEYYVMVYNTDQPKASIYYALVNNYSSNESAKKVYIVDLNNSLNSSYTADGESNPKAKSIEDLKFGEVTLLHIKNSQIVDYIEDITSIENLLK